MSKINLDSGPMKILKLAGRIIKWMLILTPVVIGGGCTMLGIRALFEKDPTMADVSADCKLRIANGDYEGYADTERLGLCLEDGFQSMGGAGVLGLMVALVGLITLFGGLAWVRHALRSQESAKSPHKSAPQ